MRRTLLNLWSWLWPLLLGSVVGFSAGCALVVRSGNWLVLLKVEHALAGCRDAHCDWPRALAALDSAEATNPAGSKYVQQTWPFIKAALLEQLASLPAAPSEVVSRASEACRQASGTGCP